MQQETSLDESFTEFAKRAEPRLRRALIAGYGPERGREATAEALAYGWTHWERLMRMENPTGYLYRVGQSRAKKGQRVERFFPAVPDDRVPWIEPGLPEALDGLSDRQRAATLLVHAFQWTYDEVAELLGVSKNTVRKHLNRAMAKLRKALEVSSDA